MGGNWWVEREIDSCELKGREHRLATMWVQREFCVLINCSIFLGVFFLRVRSRKKISVWLMVQRNL